MKKLLLLTLFAVLVISAIMIPYHIYGQTLLARYPLSANLSDATSAYADMSLQFSASYSSDSLYMNGVYNDNNAYTPAVSVDPTAFEVDLEFHLTGYGTAAGVGYNPVFMWSNSWRWMGVVVNSTDHRIGIKYNNINVIWSTATVNLNTWYTLKLQFSGSTVLLYLNNALVIQNQSMPALIHGSDFDLHLTDFGSGKTLHGAVRGLEIYNNPVLPIELNAFEAEVIGSEVKLVWETSSETNNDYFTVERTRDPDGADWAGVKTVDGAGNSQTIREYVAWDSDPLAGTAYYRLKQTDINGASTYSEVRVVTFDREAGLMIYPNPASSILALERPALGESAIEFFDLQGRRVDPKRVSGEGDKLVIDVTGLAPGIYTVAITDLHTSEIDFAKILVE